MEKLDQYLEKLKMEYKDIEIMNKIEIKKRIKDYDDERWKEELNKKPTAKIYHMRKKKESRKISMTTGIPQSYSLELGLTFWN